MEFAKATAASAAGELSGSDLASIAAGVPSTSTHEKVQVRGSKIGASDNFSGLDFTQQSTFASV
jgi:hypothetical protein